MRTPSRIEKNLIKNMLGDVLRISVPKNFHDCCTNKNIFANIALWVVDVRLPH